MIVRTPILPRLSKAVPKNSTAQPEDATLKIPPLMVLTAQPSLPIELFTGTTGSTPRVESMMFASRFTYAAYIGGTELLRLSEGVWDCHWNFRLNRTGNTDSFADYAGLSLQKSVAPLTSAALTTVYPSDFQAQHDRGSFQISVDAGAPISFIAVNGNAASLATYEIFVSLLCLRLL